MATLNVKTTTDFRNQFISNVTDIAMFGVGTVATFDASQFNGFNIATDVGVVSTSGSQEIRVVLSSPRSFSAAAWDVSGWSASARLVFQGSTGIDSITGTAANDTIRGGDGRDTLRGGGGNDTFQFDSNDIVAGEIIDGGTQTGTGSDTILASGGGSFDLSLATITGVEQLAIGGESSVTMTAAQAAGFRSFASIGGLTQSVEVSGNVVDLSHLSISVWGASRITITGTSFSANTLTGSSQADTISVVTGINTIRGGRGDDTLIGGGRRDTFLYGASETGIFGDESIDGNSDLDIIALLDPGLRRDYDFREVSLREVEILEFRGAGIQHAQFRDAQVRGGAAFDAINTIIGNAGEDLIEIEGSQIDLSTVSFMNWAAAEDRVFLSGTSGNDIITGSGQDDVINGNGGRDRLAGGAGNDTFKFFTASEFFGTSIDGGTGTDTLELRLATTYVLVPFQFTSLEALALLEGASASLSGTSFAAGGIASVTGGLGRETLVIGKFEAALGTTIDLSAVSFTAWTAGEDSISLHGTAGADTLIGSAQDDELNGGALGDLIDGGGGVNSLSYLGSNAGVTVNLGNGEVRGGHAAGDTIRNIHNIFGSTHADALFGNGLVNIINGGEGADVLFGGLNDDTFVFLRGEANGDRIVDFAGNGTAAGDQLRLVGYGAGATLVQVDATHWEIRSSFVTETLTFDNAATLHASDVLFV